MARVLWRQFPAQFIIGAQRFDQLADREPVCLRRNERARTNFVRVHFFQLFAEILAGFLVVPRACALAEFLAAQIVGAPPKTAFAAFKNSAVCETVFGDRAFYRLLHRQTLATGNPV
jgi:hypothetical protein